MVQVQPVTLQPDDSVVDLTWSESGASAEPSIGLKATGLVAGVAPPPDDFNWKDKEQSRWLRAMWSRYADASNLLFTSWLAKNGIWSDTGVAALDGFLSDAGLVDSKVAHVWLNPDTIDTGAVQVQVRVSKASPYTFPATMDTFFFCPVDMIAPPTVTLADMTITSVAIGGFLPTPAGTVQVWRVRTDATSITEQEVFPAPFPAFKTIGILMASIIDLEANTAAIGTLDVSGISTLDGGAQGAASGPLALIEGATITATKSIVGDATTPITGGLITSLDKVVSTNGIEGAASAAVDLPEGATVPTGKDLTLVGTASVAGTNASAGTFGRVEFLSGGAPPSATGMGVSAGGELFFGSASRVHHSTNGAVYATGDQEAATGLAVTTITATSTVAVTGIGAGNIRVIVRGRVQSNLVGQTNTFSLEEDQTASPAWTTIPTTDAVTALKDTSDANDWEPFTLTRIFAAGTVTGTLYRLKVAAGGGNTAKVKEVRLIVVGERG